MNSYHKPVLIAESINGLGIKHDGIYVDVTYGGGGHSAEILRMLGDKGRLIAFDRDGDSLSNMSDDRRLLLINHNFRFLKNYLKYYKALPVDGILADLGISSHQIDQADRGFSTRFNGLLDLRMDRRRKTTGADLLNTLESDQMIRVFKEYGELEKPHRLADAVIQFRNDQKIETTEDLKKAINAMIPVGQEQKYLARVFQALRLELNQEIEALKQMLKQSLAVLKPGGRLVVISYHSLEDRLVKNFMRTGDFFGIENKDPLFGNKITPFTTITKKPIVAGENEISENNRARSAKLRVAEKL